MKKWLAVAAWLLAAGAHAAPPERVAARVVTLGGSVTEIVYQLGQGGKLVGDDLSSLYPEAATKLPRVGYYRAVPVEGVLALKPDLVLASEQAGPPDALKRLGDVGVRIVTVPDAPSVDSLKARIRNIAEHACTTTGSQDPFTHARTTHAGWIARATVAPYWVNYHAEHHLFMGVPCYRLPAVHAMLGEQGKHEAMTIAPDYRTVLRQVTAAG